MVLNKEDEIEILKLKQKHKAELLGIQLDMNNLEHDQKMIRLNKLLEIAKVNGAKAKGDNYEKFV